MQADTYIKEVILESVLLLKNNSKITISDISVEIPHNSDHGDFSTNFALKNCKDFGLRPMDLAKNLVEKINFKDLDVETSIIKPGFINFKISNLYWQNFITNVIKKDEEYGKSNIGKGKKANVEFISANPTGPMHLGHLRGAVIGQIISNLLEFSGYDVTREYYINDAGAQVDVLANSVYLRYKEALGENIGEIPKGFYPGEYLKEIGKSLAKKYDKKFLNKAKEEWLSIFKDYSIQSIMKGVKEDISLLDIKFDMFFSEKSLLEDGSIKKAIDELSRQNLIYEGTLEKPKSDNVKKEWKEEKLLIFRSTKFGDSVDRSLTKADGNYTYFASDIAYHFNKFQRGFSKLINVWGADHGGYITRLKSAVSAITKNKSNLDVKICQMVKLTKDNKEIKMSKRAGTFITLKDLFNEVGKDILFFVIATRTSDMPLKLDISEIKEHSMSNPVFYIQYAHARAFSLLEKTKYASLDSSKIQNADLTILNHPKEITLIKKIAKFSNYVESATRKLEPNIITDYLYNLAFEFHSIWGMGNREKNLRFIQEDEKTTIARLTLVKAFQITLRNALKICNITPMDRME